MCASEKSHGEWDVKPNALGNISNFLFPLTPQRQQFPISTMRTLAPQRNIPGSEPTPITSRWPVAAADASDASPGRPAKSHGEFAKNAGRVSSDVHGVFRPVSAAGLIINVHCQPDHIRNQQSARRTRRRHSDRHLISTSGNQPMNRCQRTAI